MREIPIVPHTVAATGSKDPGWLARMGVAMQVHRRAIMALQWIVVVAYLVLLVVPAFMPLPPEEAHIYNTCACSRSSCSGASGGPSSC